MKTIGLLAGLGPVAGAQFYCRLLELVNAGSEADYPGVVLVSRPDIPDRIAYLVHDGPSPVEHFRAMTRQLDQAGAELIAIASATSHAFVPYVQQATSVPVVSLLEAVGQQVADAGVARLGLLATSATIELALYDPFLHADCQLLTPATWLQARLDELIYQLKCGAEPAAIGAQLLSLIQDTRLRGVDAFLLGCTELHMLADYLQGQVNIIDCVDAHILAILEMAHADTDTKSGL